MQRAVLTLLVGLMLSFSVGASALTFGKDGKQLSDAIPDQETPAELLDYVDKDNHLIKIETYGTGAGGRKPVYRGDWTLCKLVAHNIEIISEKCPLGANDRKSIARAKRLNVLRDFQCGVEGFSVHQKNKYPQYAYQRRGATCRDSSVTFTLNEHARLEKIIEADEGGSTETSANHLAVSDFNPTTAARIRSEQGLVGFVPQGANIQKFDEATICAYATTGSLASWNPRQTIYIHEAKRRGLSCGVSESSSLQTATAPKPKVSSAELTAAQKEAQRLREELVALKANQAEQQQTIAADNQVPLITITQSATDQRKGIIRGFARDNVQIAEVLVDGSAVNVAGDGSFEWTGFVPPTGKEVTIEAIDIAALSTREVVRLERGQTLQKAILRFDELNPMSGKIAQENHNALALIVGISKYDRTNAPAVFADNDAQFFRDYAALKLGIPENNITTLLNANAGQVDVLLSVKNWLARAVKQEQSDVYVFFAGHGLASDDGEKMFLLPYDGAPELLEETTIARQKLFKEIAASNPGSVTVFLDTCYSGTTRGPDMLIASRPIAIRAKEQAVPEGFTVMTAAAGDQTAKPLEEAKHGMFSYFLMKGMEGDADANQDNQITAGELHAFVHQNVIQQSSGSQTPELQGDADRVLVRFQ